jgi:hypothetical protein
MKLRALASFAEAYGYAFHRIEAVAEVDGSMKVIDMEEPLVREPSWLVETALSTSTDRTSPSSTTQRAMEIEKLISWVDLGGRYASRAAPAATHDQSQQTVIGHSSVARNRTDPMRTDLFHRDRTRVRRAVAAVPVIGRALRVRVS